MRTERLRTLVVEDERLAREELCALLEAHADIELVGQAGDIASARTLLRQAAPQLLLLDVQLSDGSGFELLDADFPPDCGVVFVTAYEAFALRAFEVDAIDYLLKPIEPERLRTAIERARSATGRALVPPSGLQYDDVLFLRVGDGSTLLPVSSILAITADGDYTTVSTVEGRQHLVLKPLKEWEARLPANAFVRIHRSAIVNLRRVRKLEAWFNHGFRVHVDGLARPLTMSRRYRHRLADRLG